MILEQILNAATLPVRVIDGTIKLGYDALAAATTKIGKDRFTLASYAINVGIPTSIAASVGYAMASNPLLASVFGINSVFGFAQRNEPNEFREYFSQPRDILNSRYEFSVKGMRIIRRLVVGTLLGGVAYGVVGGVPRIAGNDLAFVAASAYGFTMMSGLYLLDGDHSLWDKTKNTAKRAHQFLKNLRPQPQPSPQPAPQPTISYGQTASSLRSNI